MIKDKTIKQVVIALAVIAVVVLITWAYNANASEWCDYTPTIEPCDQDECLESPLPSEEPTTTPEPTPEATTQPESTSEATDSSTQDTDCAHPERLEPSVALNDCGVTPVEVTTVTVQQDQPDLSGEFQVFAKTGFGF